MARNIKYHCEIRFAYKERLRFTSVEMDLMLARFVKEVQAYKEKLNAARDYVWVEPTLITHVCSSWAEFNQYEDARQ